MIDPLGECVQHTHCPVTGRVSKSPVPLCTGSLNTSFHFTSCSSLFPSVRISILFMFGSELCKALLTDATDSATYADPTESEPQYIRFCLFSDSVFQLSFQGFNSVLLIV